MKILILYNKRWNKSKPNCKKVETILLSQECRVCA